MRFLQSGTTATVAALLMLARPDVSTAASPELSQGLVAWFPFDGDVADRSVAPNHGMAEGTPEFQPGIRGMALVCDGKTWVTVPDASSLRLEHFTLAAWVYHFQPNLRGRILEKGESDGYWLYVEKQKAKAGFFDGEYYDLRSKSAMPAEGWTFVAATYDGAQLSTYIDGKLESCMDVEGRPHQTTGPLCIGSKPNGAPYDRFTGALDDVRIYNRALSAEEVQALHQAEGQ